MCRMVPPEWTRTCSKCQGQQQLRQSLGKQLCPKQRCYPTISAGQCLACKLLASAQRTEQEPSQGKARLLYRFVNNGLVAPNNLSAPLREANEQIAILSGHQSVTWIKWAWLASYSFPPQQHIAEAHAIQGNDRTASHTRKIIEISLPNPGWGTFRHHWNDRAKDSVDRVLLREVDQLPQPRRWRPLIVVDEREPVTCCQRDGSVSRKCDIALRLHVVMYWKRAVGAPPLLDYSASACECVVVNHDNLIGQAFLQNEILK
jgi:hypothetical protein